MRVKIIAILSGIIIFLLALCYFFARGNGEIDMLEFRGLRLVYSIDSLEISEEDIGEIKEILKKRLELKGLKRFDISVDSVNPNNPLIIVEIPTTSELPGIADFLGEIAKLQFVESDGQTVVIEGNDIIGATVVYGQAGESMPENRYQIQLELSDNGSEKLSESTDRLSKLSETEMNYIAIVIDGSIISLPFVSERIETKNPVITGNFSKTQAQELAALINSGILPFDLVLEEQEYINLSIY